MFGKSDKNKAKIERDRAYRHWTKGEEQDLVRQARQGMFLEDIAVAHKRSEVAITHRAVKLKIELRKRPKSSVASEPVETPTPKRRRFWNR